MPAWGGVLVGAAAGAGAAVLAGIGLLLWSIWSDE